MSYPFLTDASMVTVQKALDGLTLRRDIIGQNVANVDTPGYRAQTTNFETALQQAMRRGSQLSMNTTSSGHMASLISEENALTQVSLRSGGSVRADGNNVDIDQELAELTETGVRYQALTTVVNKKYQLLRQAATSR